MKCKIILIIRIENFVMYTKIPRLIKQFNRKYSTVTPKNKVGLVKPRNTISPLIPDIMTVFIKLSSQIRFHTNLFNL